MKIAIFDHLVTDKNAIGKCHRELLSYLADEHEFTVFAIDFDNPRPDRIKFVKVPSLRRPLLGLMVTFHMIAPFVLWWYTIVKGEKFDLVQGVGGNFLFADLAYGHFCHRVYLNDHKDARPKEPVRRIYSWIYDSIVSMLEPFSYGNAKYIVTPSKGLAEELVKTFKGVSTEKTHVISNPISVKDLRPPENRKSLPKRAELGFKEEDMVMVFVAAGHFDRKGLPVLLNAMKIVGDERIKLIVVGGTDSMIKEYQGIVSQMGLTEQLRFVGFQNDIHPFLWASDLFAFPSSYETFSLVSFEAAGAALPLLVSRIYGVEEFLEHGVNGWQEERSPEKFASRIQFALENPEMLLTMGENALKSVQGYSPETFGQEWKSFYDELSPDRDKGAVDAVSNLSSDSI